ncbi:MAG TPA: DegT/DnrJ/EryC1/StrS family aminotransferase [Phototrophicaceae bacterium]|nr:DegT/DnrJ/EryC1/StrS family aminotransferase [Phototrophicaceae bacterium]
MIDSHTRVIPFNDLAPVHHRLKDQLQAAVSRVIERGWFILGPEIEAFEAEFAAYHEIDHAVTVANGTDALELALRAAGIGTGDEVITVAHTAVATVAAIERAGAKPVLVDISPTTYTMDASAAEAAITPRTKAIIPVHLYGNPGLFSSVLRVAQKHHLLLIEDCAQAHGARYQGRLVGTFGDMAAFSFYPTKNLGADGDGGAVITRSADFAARLRRLRTYGQTSRYVHDERGVNSRMDEMQAAILRVKLPLLNEFNAARQQLAQIYNANLRGVTTPAHQPGHVYHLYVIRHPQREALMEHLKQADIGTLIHYPIPVHLQKAYADLGYKRGSLPVSEQVASEIVSLPLYVGLSEDDARAVAEAVNSFTEYNP